MSASTTTGRRPRSLGIPLTFLAAAVATAVMGFRPSLDLTKPGIESPFTYSFNRASEAGQRWGRDYIATYGPYGYLIVTHPIGDLPERRVAFELARIIVAALAITAWVHSLPSLRAIRRVALAVLLAWGLALQTSEYRWFGIFLLLAIASVHLERPWNAIARGSAATFAGFLMLVKGSIGGAAILSTLALGLAGPLPVLPALTVGLAGIVAGMSAAWYAHQGTLRGLPTSLRLTSEIAGGYSAAVGVDPEGGWRDVLLFLAFLLALVAAAAAERSPRLWRSLIACGVPLFVVWKHAFVRQDPFHTAVILPFGLFVTLVLVSDALSRPGLQRGLPILAVAWVLLVPIAMRADQRSTVLEQLCRPWAGEGLAYLRMLPSFDQYHRKAWRMSRRLLEPLVLPDDVRAEVGNATIDVYPRQTVFAAANPDLRWSFRPAPTSYANYRPALDELNARFLDSDRRPDYLLWRWEDEQTIDGRNVLWDEPQTLRTLFERYDVIRDEPFLLRAGSQRRPTREERRGVGEAPWDAWADVPASKGPLVVRAELGSSLVRFAARGLLRENPLFLDLRLASGEVLSYRFPPDNAPSGLWIQPPLSGPADVRRMLHGEPPRRQVTAVRFRGGWATKTGGAVRLSWMELL
jgi:hypothetical protein